MIHDASGWNVQLACFILFLITFSIVQSVFFFSSSLLYSLKAVGKSGVSGGDVEERVLKVLYSGF